MAPVVSLNSPNPSSCKSQRLVPSSRLPLRSSFSRTLSPLFTSSASQARYFIFVAPPLVVSNLPHCINVSQIYYALTELLLSRGKPDDANAHIEQAKPYAVDSAYNQGRAMEQQAKVWYFRHKAEDAKSEALRAANTFEKLGAATDLERCRETLRGIQEGLSTNSSPHMPRSWKSLLSSSPFRMLVVLPFTVDVTGLQSPLLY